MSEQSDMEETAILPEQVVTPINPEALAAARAALPGEDLLAVVVQTFDALADPTRARILFALRAGELCVRDLALAVGVSESAVSHQLRLLRDRRLVRSRRDGTTIYYVVDDHHLSVLLREADYHAGHVQQDLPDHSNP
jgi:ArsR family transcriptional regulator, lead/cadmium/zinc/bismuth-responsive transcriptional repressor